MEEKKSISNKVGSAISDNENLWLGADKTTVQNYLEENICDMKEYQNKKKEIMKQLFKQSEMRLEKPVGVSNNLFIVVMIAMAIIGLIASYFYL